MNVSAQKIKEHHSLDLYIQKTITASKSAVFYAFLAIKKGFFTTYLQWK
jgi:hypothetical protein